nr:C45 family autoproteolytic acyltransferase/hydolase [uncultured Marinifilum sp.]
MHLKKLLLILIYFLPSSLLFSQEYNFQEKDGVKTFHEGSMFVKEGVPFLTVKGDSYEMGLQYGVLMNNILNEMDVKIDSIIDSYIGTFFIKRMVANKVLKSKIRKIEKNMPPEYIRELEGMADGSDLKLKELKLIAYFPQLFYKISCTAFVLRNETSLVHGRNLDWPGMDVFVKYPLIVNYYKKNKIPITLLTFTSYPGAYTGINHKGLSMSINMNACPAAKGKKSSDYNTGMPLAYKVRNILENADNLNKVDQEFKNYSSHAWFIMAGSKKDHSAAMYELTRGEIIKNKMKDNMLAITNLSLSHKGRFDYSSINMHNDSNITREDKLAELNQKIENGNLVEKAYKMVSCPEYYHLKYDPYYGSINNDITVKSCILDNSKNKIYFSYDNMFAGLGQFLEYDISSNKASVYKEKQEIPGIKFINNKLTFVKWYRKNYGKKKKLDTQDYKALIDYLEHTDLEPAYKLNLLARYYANLENKDKAMEYANKYVEHLPKYSSAYYTKFIILNHFKDYKTAISTINTMLEKSIVMPADIFWAKRNQLKAYDKLQAKSPNTENIDAIKQLAQEIFEESDKYFKPNWIEEYLDEIKKVVEKY